MSMYTTLQVNFLSKIDITSDKLTEIQELLIGNCAIREDRKKDVIEGKKIDLAATFNYGLDKALKLLEYFQNNLIENEDIPISIGEFGSELVYDLYSYLTNIYSYKGRLFIVCIDRRSDWVDEISYKVINTDNVIKDFAYDDNDPEYENLELVLDHFINATT